MTGPVRLQLSRKKGFNLQAHSRAVNGLPAVNVARGPRRKWGNPWRIGMCRCTGKGGNYREEPVDDNATAVRFFRDMLLSPSRNYPLDGEIAASLRGKNLACWCRLCPAHAGTGLPLGEACPACAPCHASVLLSIANSNLVDAGDST